MKVNFTVKDIENRASPKPWYRITNQADGKAELFIYDEISFFGVTADQFTRELIATEAQEIIVRINSIGGDLFDGIAIYNALRSVDARIVTKVDSLAASIASVIVQAGDERLMMPHGQMMIHEAHGVAIGDADEMLAAAELLDKESNLIAEIYAEASKSTSADKFRELMKAETWLTDKEALDLGLVDEIVDLEKAESSINEGESDSSEEPTNKAVDWQKLFAEAETNSRSFL